MPNNKWSRGFWIDLGERVGSTFLGAVLTLITMDSILEGPDWDTTLWPIVVVPTAVSLIKGLLANLADPESGASLAPAPPGPVVVENGNEVGAVNLGTAVIIFLLALIALAVFFGVRAA